MSEEHIFKEKSINSEELLESAKSAIREKFKRL